MKSSSITQLQKELNQTEPKKVVELCLKLAKYKKENKELLSYLLLDAGDEQIYVSNIKNEISELFDLINTTTMYFSRKGVRKVLRQTNKYIKYSGLPQTELELRIYFCKQLKSSGIQINKSETLINLYSGQVDKIKKTLSKLHEDIQFDYKKEVDVL